MQDNWSILPLADWYPARSKSRYWESCSPQNALQVVPLKVARFIPISLVEPAIRIICRRVMTTFEQ